MDPIPAVLLKRWTVVFLKGSTTGKKRINHIGIRFFIYLNELLTGTYQFSLQLIVFDRNATIQ